MSASSEKVPLVSVCVITYNHEKFIGRCLDGIVMQKTDFPVEAIVHDDASTDRTADIIREYAEKYPDIIKPICQTENQHSKGVRISAKLVWPKARGKYLAFCEGDDYWKRLDKLQMQVNIMETDPEIGLVHSDTDFHFLEKDTILKEFNRFKNFTPNPNPEKIFEGLLTAEYRIYTPTVCCRKKLLDQICENDPAFFLEPVPFVAGDLPRWLELSTMCRFDYIPESLTVMNRLQESASRSMDKTKWANMSVNNIELREYMMKKHNRGFHEWQKSMQKRAFACMLRACYYGYPPYAEKVLEVCGDKLSLGTKFLYRAATLKPRLLRPVRWLIAKLFEIIKHVRKDF